MLGEGLGGVLGEHVGGEGVEAGMGMAGWGREQGSLRGWRW